MAWDSSSLKPEHYISETRYDEYGNKITIHRNPHPDPEMQSKAIQEIADILMIGVRRGMMKEQAKEERACP